MCRCENAHGLAAAAPPTAIKRIETGFYLDGNVLTYPLCTVYYTFHCTWCALVQTPVATHYNQ